MSWEPITNMKPSSAKALSVPNDGVALSTRVLNARKSAASPAKQPRYIKMRIGAGLAKKLCLVGEDTKLQLSLGGGVKYAGFVAMSVDMTDGAFPAKRAKDGGYTLTINAASAAGLFALDFPAFTAPAEGVAVMPPAGSARAGPPMFAFRASSAMLEGADA